jgi:hypothetical protein
MNTMRNRYVPILSVVLISVFLSLLAVETSHHHGQLEENDNCSVCAWQATGSPDITAPVPPVLSPVLLVTVLFVFWNFFSFCSPIPSRGRSPPLFPL